MMRDQHEPFKLTKEQRTPLRRDIEFPTLERLLAELSPDEREWLLSRLAAKQSPPPGFTGVGWMPLTPRFNDPRLRGMLDAVFAPARAIAEMQRRESNQIPLPAEWLDPTRPFLLAKLDQPLSIPPADRGSGAPAIVRVGILLGGAEEGRDVIWATEPEYDHNLVMTALHELMIRRGQRASASGEAAIVPITDVAPVPPLPLWLRSELIRAVAAVSGAARRRIEGIGAAKSVEVALHPP